ncbi:MAG: type II secretion system protein [Lachnospiraceae bacterium]|nr:type II secretion system protein [Lachnospiraceae bacterium]
MKKLLNKKNNKGFSLVELIVVVLIMGIIAVALAPQVMKWVGTSKEKTDDSNAAALKSSVQTALADWQITNNLPSGGTATYTVSSGTTTLVGGAGDSVCAGLGAKIDEVTAKDYPEPQACTQFNISIDCATGKVDVSKS